MSKLSPSYGDIREVKVIEVVMVERGVGKGEESSPYRLIKEYYDPKTGVMLARTDNLAKFNPMTNQKENEFDR